MVRKALLFIPVFVFIASWIRPGQLNNAKSHDVPAAEDAFKYKLSGDIYLSLHEPSLNPDAFRLGLLGFNTLLSQGMVRNDTLLTIIDFSLPSSVDRFFVINLVRHQILFKSLVSHGRNSGDLYASRFSNKMQSHETALGFFLTGESYLGGQGYSLQLQGVDTGYNDLSKVRGIIIHGANYVTRNYISRYGRLGRSFGCPALPPELSKQIINLIKDGSVLFSYFPDQVYFDHSVILRAVPQSLHTDGGI
jgi:hypothetical protein